MNIDTLKKAQPLMEDLQAASDALEFLEGNRSSGEEFSITMRWPHSGETFGQVLIANERSAPGFRNLLVDFLRGEEKRLKEEINSL